MLSGESFRRNGPLLDVQLGEEARDRTAPPRFAATGCPAGTSCKSVGRGRCPKDRPPHSVWETAISPVTPIWGRALIDKTQRAEFSLNSRFEFKSQRV